MAFVCRIDQDPNRVDFFSYTLISHLDTRVLRVSLSSLTYWQAAAPNLLPTTIAVPVRYYLTQRWGPRPGRSRTVTRIADILVELLKEKCNALKLAWKADLSIDRVRGI